MQLLELTLPAAAENIALDEALLEEADAAGQPRELLRLWETSEPVVVVGSSSRIDDEVHVDACRADAVPILRRTSGGAAIVTGKGCLMYSLVLSYALRHELRGLDVAHTVVLDKIGATLRDLLPSVERCGTSDLAVDNYKFSGNSMRCKRTHLLYHGTLLYDFDVSLIGSCLRMPPRVPDYREGRIHADFIMNLPISRDAIRDALDRAWPPESNVTNWPAERVAELVDSRFARDDWNFEFA